MRGVPDPDNHCPDPDLNFQNVRIRILLFFAVEDAEPIQLPRCHSFFKKYFDIDDIET
jgi:hypothetical protein